MALSDDLLPFPAIDPEISLVIVMEKLTSFLPL
jgi:hypothetical protein